MRRTKITLQQLENFLSAAADLLYGKMDASVYKEYILGLLFLKRLSDVFDEKRVELKKQYKHLPAAKLAEILETRASYGDTRVKQNDGRHKVCRNQPSDKSKTAPPHKRIRPQQRAGFCSRLGSRRATTERAAASCN
jgi:molybdenum cofactor biosynthesis enzyme MoaA